MVSTTAPHFICEKILSLCVAEELKTSLRRCEPEDKEGLRGTGREVILNAWVDLQINVPSQRPRESVKLGAHH